jgi:hemolysin activation/secretion protein
MENNDPKASRAGADNKFTKAYVNLARVQRAGDYFSIIFRGSGQASTDSLVSIEQFSIGGADSVRGYPQGEFFGDHGYNVSTELRVSPWANKVAQLAFFVDNGGISVKNPPAGTKKYRHLTGVGYGLRLSLPYNLSARFDLGFPVQPSKTSSKERPVAHVQGAVMF